MTSRRYDLTGPLVCVNSLASLGAKSPGQINPSQAKVLVPTAERAGIDTVGRHTLRQGYSSLLHALGNTLIVQQELLCHADIHSTVNLHTHAVDKDKREAQFKVA